MRRRRSLVVLVSALIALAITWVIVGQTVGADDMPSKVDVGFLQDMIDHHDQANLMAQVALHGDASTISRNLAVDVLTSQRYEIGLMEEWLRERGLARGAPHRTAMAWMGMRVTPATMPGMATTAQITALGKLRGSAFDRELLHLMIEHHEGGIHMATAAAEHASDGHVRWLAGRMARNQRREILEIESLLSALPDA